MKKEKIEELFIANAAFSYCGAGMMDIDDFTQAINQAEKEMKLEWYKKLEKKLKSVIKVCYVPKSIEIYHIEIKTKQRN